MKTGDVAWIPQRPMMVSFVEKADPKVDKQRCYGGVADIGRTLSYAVRQTLRNACLDYGNRQLLLYLGCSGR